MDAINETKVTVQNCIPFVQQNECTDIARMLATLIAKADETKSELLCLRRQVARIELKSTVNQNSIEGNATSELNHSVFLDFESALATEGFSIKSVHGVYALEKQLKETAYSSTSYRQKLVCILV